MAFDLETVKATVKSFADEVRRVLPVAKVYLYGSYAKGQANDYSDVDVCIFLTSFEDKTWFDIMGILLKISAKYEMYIEPVVFEMSDFEDKDEIIVCEALSTGIEIL
ncbi:MAG: nucleotidyltransferase domain-containing protein [Deltaproteobacteria bacterium]|jgi:predicted nucleotidyltransferase|nr:nucleotidyltransferase domain-containing protein [Deltaproteobacteria bacterium]